MKLYQYRRRKQTFSPNNFLQILPLILLTLAVVCYNIPDITFKAKQRKTHRTIVTNNISELAGKSPIMFFKLHTTNVSEKLLEYNLCLKRYLIPFQCMPISLLAVISKIMELVIKSTKLNCLETNRFIHKKQYGYRIERSTADLLTFVTLS